MKQSLILIAFFSTIFIEGAYAQISVNGPSCVTVGTVYKYTFGSIPSGSANMKICVSGGAIAGTNGSCYNGSPVSYIIIVWDSMSTGSIAVSGAAGNAAFSVNKAIVFSGGKIDSLLRIQAVNPGWIPLSINCSDARGGSCSPVYTYQWQQSADGMHWTNVPDAVSKQFRFSASPLANVYYRRKTMETVSNSENYSDIAIVYLKPASAVNP